MITLYDVLRRPVVTEKSNYLMSKLHQYVFEVTGSATKTMVKDAIETLFEVKVLNVNILRMPAKRTRKAKSRRLSVRNPGYKKAIVTLSPEDRIPFFEGVE
jgi:large subunit ribosomal protein L23